MSMSRITPSIRSVDRCRLVHIVDNQSFTYSLPRFNSIATSSRVTLAMASPNLFSHQSQNTISGRTLMTSTANIKRNLHRIRTFTTTKVKAMATMTRQPESPEEPEVFSGSEPPSIILTDRAVQHLAKVSSREKNRDLALRIAVEPGGCHGYQYKMEITSEMEDDDFRFSSGDSVHLLIDSTSLRLIKGSTIDYVTELIGSQFAILNNPQAKGAGCGCGVSWEPNF